MEERREWHLPTWEVGKPLRWLGVHDISSQALQVLVDEVDVNGSQNLDFSEFSKIMRKLHENSVNIILRAFPPPDHDLSVAAKIFLNGPDMQGILRQSGISITKEQRQSV